MPANDDYFDDARRDETCECQQRSPEDSAKRNAERDKQTGSLGVDARQEGLTPFLRALVLRRVLVDADQAHDSGIGGIGKVRHPMGLHAPCELQFFGEGLLVLRAGGYPGWEEVATRLSSRDELRGHSIDTARGW
jgi:hypothetical protein